MTFRKLLEQYEAGTLDEAARAEVEEAIDRQDAILEYLSEREEIPALEGAPDADAGAERETQLEQRFSAELTRRIRRAFARLGLAVGAVLLALLLLIQFVLPHAVDLLYYDPGETVAVKKTEYNTFTTNRMSLDMAVYSELFLPGAYREHVSVYDRGFGDYDIVLVQNVALSGQDFHNVGGRVTRGRLTLYDNDTFRPPVGNAFEWGLNMPDPARSLSGQILRPTEDENGVTTHYAVGMAGYPEEARERLEALQEGRLYQAYVSLDRVMDYDSFASFLKREGLGAVWCAVMVDEKPGYAPNVGFFTDFGNGGNMLCWDEAKYPLLKHDSFSEENALRTVETGDEALTHLTSLLRYYGDQPRFAAMMNGQTGSRFDPEKMISYLEQNGVTVYGFSFAAGRDTLLALQDLPEVYSVAAEPLR